MVKILSRLVDLNAREIKRLEKSVGEINKLEPKAKKLKDADFPKKTEELRKRVKKSSLEDVLPEAFALVREAARRAVGMRPYDVQLMAGVALFGGKIAEQKTGEGKTLSAVAPLYLRALTGRGVHLVTVNGYLARIGAGWMAPAYSLLGMSVGVIDQEQKSYFYDPSYSDKAHGDERLEHLKPASREKAYQADITYGTNNEFGFDYLRDNMVAQANQMVQRGHYFAIVDEVDQVLIDEARTPLIISAPNAEPTDKYYKMAQLVKELQAETDYAVDEKARSASLTEAGIEKVEKMMGVENLYERDFDTIHHIENALKAASLYQKDKEYVINENEVIIVDEFTGRLMPGRRWSDGLHQAVEAKEEVTIQQESKTMATISFQNYFRMYEKLSGMTGTAETEADEFRKIYNLDVVVIPTNEAVIRKDYGDSIYKTRDAKYRAVTKEVDDKRKAGQPVLVGTTSIENNEIISHYFKKAKIPHSLLNAKNHEREASIIAEAGSPGAVTVATNMAGRGVDIVLGGPQPARKTGQSYEKYKASRAYEKWKQEHNAVVRAGGLHVVGTERHESRRIDNQLRGRSGRQGDPGSTRFYLSLEDDLMRIFGGEQISGIMNRLKLPEDQPIENKLVSRAIQQAQVKVEGHNFDIRKRLVEYDDVANQQREVVYGLRKKVLVSKSLKEEVLKKLEQAAEATLVGEFDAERVIIGILGIVPMDESSRDALKKQIEKTGPDGARELLVKLIHDAHGAREKQVGEEAMRMIERYAYLGAIDHVWVDHIDTIDGLRESVSLRGYAQRDPLVEFKNEAYSLFENLVDRMDEELARRIFRIQVAAPRTEIPLDRVQTNIDKTDQMGLAPSAGGGTQNTVHRTQKKVGRNDPCPCGSGLKYKKCHLNREPQTTDERMAFNLYNSDHDQWVKQYGGKKN